MKIALLIVKDKKIIGVWDKMFLSIEPQNEETIKEIKKLVEETASGLKDNPDAIKFCQSKYWDMNHAKEFISKLETNDLCVMPIETKDFVVSTLNNWMDGECAKYFTSEFECPVEDLVDKNGFGYDEDEDYISRIDYGTEITPIKEYVVTILIRLCQCETLKDKIQTLEHYLKDFD